MFGSQRAFYLLLGAAVATVVLWQLPLGHLILYPFTILATWFHEMAHGLTALLLGGSFLRLDIYPNGSGMASYTLSSAWGHWGSALVAAGGPLGPPLAGAVFIFAGRYPRSAKICLLLLSATLGLSVVLWIRSGFGVWAIAFIAVIVGIIAVNAPNWLRQVMIQFLGVQACISTYQQIDYLFTASATIDGQYMVSDTGQMAENLFFPHWFWAVVIIVLSIGLLWTSLRLAYRQPSVGKLRLHQ